MASASRERVYKEVIEYKAKHGYAPTIRELCDLTGLRSTSTVHQHLTNLIVDGKLTRKDASPRSLSTARDFLENSKLKVIEIRDKKPYRIEVDGRVFVLEEEN